MRLKPHLMEEFKIPPDPLFTEKVVDITGLYLNPPDAAVVFCVDEKPQIQALDRTAPILPLMPGAAQRRTHDYRRCGTVNLYSALNVASGRVIASMTKRRRVKEFKDFLNLIDKETPPELDVHIILDNASPHKSDEILKWLKNTNASNSTTPPLTRRG